MIEVVFFVIGLMLGDRTARRRGGNVADRAQYALVFGILAVLAALVVNVIVVRIDGV